MGDSVRRRLPVPGQVHAPPGRPHQGTDPAGVLDREQRIGLPQDDRGAGAVRRVQAHFRIRAAAGLLVQP